MQRRFNLFLAVATVAALLCNISCTDDRQADDSLISKPLNEVKLTFDLGLNAQLSTRAFEQRPLESSDNWQRVNSVRVYAFRSDTETGPYTYYRPLLNDAPLNYIYVGAFSGKDAVYTQEPFEEHQYLEANLKLTDGWYKFVAIGREDIDGDNEAGSQWNFTTLTEGETNVDALTASTTSNSAACTELFVGQTTGVQVTAPTPIHETIILYRKVAGVLMYVENVPSKVNSTDDVKRIGIVRRKHTYALNLLNPVATGSELSFAAAGATLVGTTPAATDYVVSYDLTSATSSNDYYVDTNTTNTVHPNSIFKGAFVTPQDAPAADNTLELVLCDAAGKVLQSKHIKLVKSNNEDVTPTLLYPLVANNIYCIGQRNQENNVDEPIDLSNPTDDIIMVHGSWQADVNIDM